MRAIIVSTTLLVLLSTAAPVSQSPTVLDGLQTYSAGDVTRALAPVRSVNDLKAVQQALRQDAPTWIGSGDGADRRALIAATFALEVVAKPLASDDTAADTAVTRAELLEWAAQALPSSLASGPVRDWFRATIAFVETKDWNGLTPLRSTIVRAWQLPPLKTTALIVLALDRFPDDPQFLLSQAIVEARFGWPVPAAPGQPFRDSPLDLSIDQSSIFSTGSLLGSERDRQALLNDAQGHFEKLIAVPEVSAAAHLRAGHLQLALAERGNARKHFREAERLATDAATQYLCKLFTGWSWDHDKHPAEAEASYRSALLAAPGDRAASTLLTALLFSTDRRAESVQLMESALRTSPSAANPLKTFMEGDGHHWPAALMTLRSQLK